MDSHCCTKKSSALTDQRCTDAPKTSGYNFACQQLQKSHFHKDSSVTVWIKNASQLHSLAVEGPRGWKVSASQHADGEQHRDSAGGAIGKTHLVMWKKFLHCQIDKAAWHRDKEELPYRPLPDRDRRAPVSIAGRTSCVFMRKLKLKSSVRDVAWTFKKEQAVP